MVVIEPGPNQSIVMEQRIPHELMHVMLYRSIGAGYNNLPAWLREGTATLAEVKAVGGVIWRFQSAPPRRSG